MKTFSYGVLLALFLLSLFSFVSTSATNDSSLIEKDSISEDRQRLLALLREQIRGKEDLPADSVFKDIKIFKGVPSKRLLSIMEMGYSKSLGVSCGHCHDTKNWASDPKFKKQITREMVVMTEKINNQFLKNIDGLLNPIVNCTTCHRGNVKPAINLK